MDKAVAHDLTVNFQARLLAANVRCDLITITNGTHRIADWEKFDPAWQGKLMSWLNEQSAAK